MFLNRKEELIKHMKQSLHDIQTHLMSLEMLSTQYDSMQSLTIPQAIRFTDYSSSIKILNECIYNQKKNSQIVVSFENLIKTTLAALLDFSELLNNFQKQIEEDGYFLKNYHNNVIQILIDKNKQNFENELKTNQFRKAALNEEFQQRNTFLSSQMINSIFPLNNMVFDSTHFQSRTIATEMEMPTTLKPKVVQLIKTEYENKANDQFNEVMQKNIKMEEEEMPIKNCIENDVLLHPKDLLTNNEPPKVIKKIEIGCYQCSKKKQIKPQISMENNSKKDINTSQVSDTKKVDGEQQEEQLNQNKEIPKNVFEQTKVIETCHHIIQEVQERKSDDNQSKHLLNLPWYKKEPKQENDFKKIDLKKSHDHRLVENKKPQILIKKIQVVQQQKVTRNYLKEQKQEIRQKSLTVDKFLTTSDMKQIYKWCAKNVESVVFDSEINSTDLGSTEFFEAMRTITGFIICIEDFEKNRFGVYLTRKITDSNTFFMDQKCFVFKLKEKGREKFDRYLIRPNLNKFAFKIDKKDSNSLFNVGDGDIIMMRKNKQQELWCSCKMNAFDYDGRKVGICGEQNNSTFKIQKFAVYTLKN
ncbi:hypothetical protein EIN_528180 [Entamoeba invadens IP1]|uniref:TLDc domain-containing protein n=1 Tax=Entamoeba invadens IP1 TaxID=370355 RepID=A0A0A1TZ15_ENTIV|nr:hypothetical protein EIN_528180 [Entamoeba invadens IP1]ELP86779.1 hypothetical protein EIN_528180 [Entamoeba invadens IP1]|eukprot:XP_004253550.1 hypothetical protein EIN_528180 [Entamoeba invadens IP1]